MQELIFKFKYGGKGYHTMPRDGEGKHAIWEQVFMLTRIKDHMDTDICLEGHEGSPLESKMIAATKPWKPKDIINESNLSIGGEAVVKEVEMFTAESEDAAAFVIIAVALVDEAQADEEEKQEAQAEEADVAPKKVEAANDEEV